MIAGILHLITEWYYRGVGSTRLNAVEDLCFRAWREIIPTQGRAILDSQIGRVSYVERQAGGAKVICRYPSDEPHELFRNTEPDQVVAIVILGPIGVTSDQHNFHANIIVHRGRFFSIEFPKAPRRLLKKHAIPEEQLRVVRVEQLLIVE